MTMKKFILLLAVGALVAAGVCAVRRSLSKDTSAQEPTLQVIET